MEHIEQKDLKLITLRNKNQTELEILNFGATLFSFKMNDSSGKRVNLIVSPKRPEDFITARYKDYEKFFGASIGRFAGRIHNGEFSIDKEKYELPQKDGVHLHGGDDGLQYKIWKVEEETSGTNPSVTLSYLSKDGEAGYPGNLSIRVIYTLSEDDVLSITYTAETDRKTIVNLTNHAYFNLNGEGSVSDHFLFINADKILKTDDHKLPTGDLINLRKHPKNFGSNKLIGNRPFDDAFVLNSNDEEVSARLFSPITGIKMEMRTNQNAIIAFAPEELPSSLKYQTSISREYPSISLEAQNFPDAPNFRNFPSSILAPGEKYINEISLSFSVKK